MGLGLLAATNDTVRDLATFIGTLVAAEPAVYLGYLRIKRLEVERNQWLSRHKGDFNGSITLSGKTRELVKW